MKIFLPIFKSTTFSGVAGSSWLEIATFDNKLFVKEACDYAKWDNPFVEVKNKSISHKRQWAENHIEDQEILIELKNNVVYVNGVKGEVCGYKNCELPIRKIKLF